MKLIKNNESYMIILPKQLVLAKQWKHGDKLRAIVNQKGNLEIVKEKL